MSLFYSVEWSRSVSTIAMSGLEMWKREWRVNKREKRWKEEGDR